MWGVRPEATNDPRRVDGLRNPACDHLLDGRLVEPRSVTARPTPQEPRSAHDVMKLVDERNAAIDQVARLRKRLAEAQRERDEWEATCDAVTAECGRLGLAGGMMQAERDAERARADRLQLGAGRLHERIAELEAQLQEADERAHEAVQQEKVEEGGRLDAERRAEELSAKLIDAWDKLENAAETIVELTKEKK